MTVAELIEHLSKMPQDVQVWADGCDCSNPVNDVSIGYDGTVYINVDTKR